MQLVAKLAGVSTSTVSRVVNDDPRVAANTAEAVRRAMRQISFTPGIRRGSARTAGAARSVRTGTIAVLILGSSGHQAPAFEQLLRGVLSAAGQNDVEAIISFVSNPSDLPARLAQRKVDGLLLLGKAPDAAMQSHLQTFASVWLLSDHHRPAWGDVVLPDNTVIGELAARYLIGRGHKHLACLGVDPSSWTMNIRAMAFGAEAQASGVEVQVTQTASHNGNGLGSHRTMGDQVEHWVDQLLGLTPRPTGWFINQECAALLVDASLARRGMKLGRGNDVELVVCGDSGSHLIGHSPAPAIIDPCAEAIGRRGVEQLLWRLRNPGVDQRMYLLIEPVLLNDVS